MWRSQPRSTGLQFTGWKTPWSIQVCVWGLEYSPYTCKVVSLWSTRWSSPKVGLRVVRGIAQSRESFLCKGAPWPPKNKDRPERGARISIASASLSALAQVGPASRSRTSWRKKFYLAACLHLLFKKKKKSPNKTMVVWSYAGSGS